MRPTTFLAGLLLAAVVAATLVGVVRHRPRPGADDIPAAAAPEAPDLVRSVPDQPPPPPPTAPLIVDARPWGKLVAVASADGEPWHLPPVTTTPLRLELPAGTWRLELLHPRQPQERRGCEVELLGGGSGRCEVEFATLSVDGYFREQGWWR